MDCELGTLLLDEEDMIESRTENEEVPEGPSNQSRMHTTSNNSPATINDHIEEPSDPVPGFVTPENTIGPPVIPGTGSGAAIDPTVTPDTPPGLATDDADRFNRVQALFNNILHHTSDAVFQHASNDRDPLFTSSSAINQPSPILATGVQSIPVHVSDRATVRPTRFPLESFNFHPPIFPTTTASSIAFQPTIPNANNFPYVQPRMNAHTSFRFAAPHSMHPYARMWQPPQRQEWPVASHIETRNITSIQSEHVTTVGPLHSASTSGELAVGPNLPMSSNCNLAAATGHASESDLLRPVTCSAQHLDFKNVHPMVELRDMQTSQASNIVQDVLAQAVGSSVQRDSDKINVFTPNRQNTRNTQSSQGEQNSQVLTLDSIFGSNLGPCLWNDTDDIRFAGPSLNPQILLQPSTSVTKDKEAQRLRNTINQMLTEKCQMTKELKDAKEALLTSENYIKGLRSDLNKSFTEINHLRDKVNRYKDKLQKAQVIQDAAFRLTLECGKLQAGNHCLKLQNDRLAKDIDALFDFFAKKRRHNPKNTAVAADRINEVGQKADVAGQAAEGGDEHDESDETDDDDEDSGEDMDDDNDDGEDLPDDDDDDDNGGHASGSGAPPPNQSEDANEEHGEPDSTDTQFGNLFSYERIIDNQTTSENLGIRNSVCLDHRWMNQLPDTTKSVQRKENLTDLQKATETYLHEIDSETDDPSESPHNSFEKIKNDFLKSLENSKSNRPKDIEGGGLSDEPRLKKMKYTDVIYPLLKVAN